MLIPQETHVNLKSPAMEIMTIVQVLANALCALGLYLLSVHSRSCKSYAFSLKLFLGAVSI